MVLLQVYPLNLHVDWQDIVDVNDQHLYFGNHEEWYFVAVICTWLFNNVHKGFETEHGLQPLSEVAHQQ